MVYSGEITGHKFCYLSYRYCTKWYPLANSEMEYSYKENKKRYDLLHKWATKENLNDIRWTEDDHKTNWIQFHRDTFHINPALLTLGNSEEVQIWDVSTLSITECMHSQKTDCLMMRDMVTIVQLVYKKLMPSDSSPSELSQVLRPTMTVVGSVAEGTRLVVGNEMDLLMEFPEIKGAFEIRNDDPFHLYCTSKTPTFLKQNFFNDREEFQFHKFKAHFLSELDKVLDDIYAQGSNPPRLKRGKWKDHLQKGTLNCQSCQNKMEENDLLEQCCNGSCMATVAQSKTGFCLQFEWIDDDRSPYYCSIDIVPVFPIKEKNPMDLARIIITAMRMKDHPQGWFHQIRKYEVCDRIVKGIQSPNVTSVVLKTMNCLEDRNYFIRPGQPLGWDKFPDAEIKDYYCRIKLMIKAKGVKNLGNYMVKKLLLKPEFHSCDLDDILDHEEFRSLR